MQRICAAVLGGALLVGFAVRPISAQVLYGSAVGTVHDPTGDVVTEAPVMMTSKATRAIREAKTDQQGRFTFANLLPSAYDLKVTAAGFRTFTQTDIVISINSVTRVEVKLDLGQVTEQVTVQANAVMLQTDKSDVRSEVTSQAVGNLPLAAYRNFQNLIDLVPGATP